MDAKHLSGEFIWRGLRPQKIYGDYKYSHEIEQIDLFDQQTRFWTADT